MFYDNWINLVPTRSALVPPQWRYVMHTGTRLHLCYAALQASMLSFSSMFTLRHVITVQSEPEPNLQSQSEHRLAISGK